MTWTLERFPSDTPLGEEFISTSTRKGAPDLQEI